MPPEFAIRSDSVDVGEIMKQIRARIREKRGVDYTDEEIRQLASVKMERFLDPTRVRSDLVQQYRRAQEPVKAPAPEPPPEDVAFEIPELERPPENYAFEDYHVYGSARGFSGWLIKSVRRLLNPVLKLFINPNPIIHVLHRQSAINTHNEQQFDRVARRFGILQHVEAVRADRVDRRFERMDWRMEHFEHVEAVWTDRSALDYEVLHNLVVELTRLSIEVKNIKMRIESVSSRLDFSDRRARALESVVQCRPGTGPAAEETAAAASLHGAEPRQAATHGADSPAEAPIKGEAQRARRRRRRRGRGGPVARPGTGGAPARAESAVSDHELASAAEIPEHPGADRGGSLPFERDEAPATEPPGPSADSDSKDQ